MSDDIIERLRNPPEQVREFDATYHVYQYRLGLLAADEIERLQARETRLREALEKIASAPYPDTRFNGRGMIPDFDGFKSIARAALEDEKK